MPYPTYFQLELLDYDTVEVSRSHTHGRGSDGYYCATVSLFRRSELLLMQHCAMKPFSPKWPIVTNGHPTAPDEVRVGQWLYDGTWQYFSRGWERIWPAGQGAPRKVSEAR
jgi:hypothetical protein